MALREGCSLPYLRLKQALTESDTNAVISTGQGGYELLPVLFRTVNGKQELYVDVDDQLINPRSLPGFVRLERMPEEIALEQAAAPAQKPVASNLAEARQLVEQEATQTIAQRQAARRSDNSVELPSKWQAFSEYARQERNAKFGSR